MVLLEMSREKFELQPPASVRPYYNGLLLEFPGNPGLSEAFLWLLERGRSQEARALIDLRWTPSGKLSSWLAVFKREKSKESRSEILRFIEECKQIGHAQHLWGFVALLQEGLEEEFDLSPLQLLQNWDQGWSMVAEDCYTYEKLDVLWKLHSKLPEDHPLSMELVSGYPFLDPGYCLEFGERLVARKPGR